MTKGLRNSTIAGGAAVVIGVFFLTVTHSQGQAQNELSQGRLPQRTARIAGKPNLSGIWQVANEANWDVEAHGAQPAPITQEGVHPLARVPAAPFLALGAMGA